jgi:hypothetical protein
MSSPIADDCIRLSIYLKLFPEAFKDNLIVFKEAHLTQDGHGFCLEKYSVDVNPMGEALHL